MCTHVNQIGIQKAPKSQSKQFSLCVLSSRLHNVQFACSCHNADLQSVDYRFRHFLVVYRHRVLRRKRQSGKAQYDVLEALACKPLRAEDGSVSVETVCDEGWSPYVQGNRVVVKSLESVAAHERFAVCTQHESAVFLGNEIVYGRVGVLHSSESGEQTSLDVSVVTFSVPGSGVNERAQGDSIDLAQSTGRVDATVWYVDVLVFALIDYLCVVCVPVRRLQGVDEQSLYTHVCLGAQARYQVTRVVGVERVSYDRDRRRCHTIVPVAPLF